MAERFVYLNGDYVPERDVKVSVLDRDFRGGDAVWANTGMTRSIVTFERSK